MPRREKVTAKTLEKMTSERRDAKMPLECGDCGTQWDEHFSLPMNIEVFIKKGKALVCPNCGSQKIYMLPKGDFYVPDEPTKIRDIRL